MAWKAPIASQGGNSGGFFRGTWPLWFLAAVYAYSYADDHLLTPAAKREQEISYSQFVQRARSNTITEITINNDEAVGRAMNAQRQLQATFKTRLPANTNVAEAFQGSNADIKVAAPGWSFFDYLTYGIIALIGWQVFAATGLKGRLLREKEIKEEKSDVTFDDIAGIDEIEEEVREIVSFLKDAKGKGGTFGIKTPKGLLLAGAPGNGKTLLAKAIAGEADVAFFSAAATEFENMFYGNSAKQVRDLFAKARASAPCIIFIDEIDAIGRKRQGGDRSAHDSIVVELLNQMDGFESLEGVLVIAATNKPEVLDPALLRPGRFDRKIVVPSPDIGAREQILKVHTRNRPISPQVKIREVAERTYGFSGADLAHLVNEAAIHASRRPGAETIIMSDFESAIDRIIMGLKRNLSMTPDQKRVTAIHEAGHTILALAKEKDGAMPLHKVTIAPHGQALGVTMMRPGQETYGYTLKQLKSQLVVLFGGRVAEEIMLGKDEVGTGASDDIQKATDIAWNMVTKFGFSDLGPIRFGNGVDGYLGPSFDHDLDEHTSSRVYEQVAQIVREAESEACQILTDRKADLEKLANELTAKETMLAEEVTTLLRPAIR